MIVVGRRRLNLSHVAQIFLSHRFIAIIVKASSIRRNVETATLLDIISLGHISSFHSLPSNTLAHTLKVICEIQNRSSNEKIERLFLLNLDFVMSLSTISVTFRQSCALKRNKNTKSLKRIFVSIRRFHSSI